jgi:hypothetical protein
MTTVRLRHRDPATEPERSGRRHARDRDLDVVARDVDFEHVVFEIALFAESGEHLLVLGRDVLRSCWRWHTHGAHEQERHAEADE